MSSILEALKKAEQEEHATKPLQTIKQEAFQSQHAGGKKRGFLGIIALLVGLMAAAGAGLFFFDKQSPEKTLPSSLINPRNIPPSGADSLEKDPIQMQPPAFPLDKPPGLSVEKHPQKKVEKQAEKQLQKPIEPQAPKITDDPVRNPVITDAPGSSGPASAAPPLDQITALEDDSISIQAISWTQVSSERVVVINNKILGENERILEYHIKQINPEDVVLEKTGQLFRLKFKYR